MKRYSVIFFLTILIHTYQYSMHVTIQDLAFDHFQESKYCITIRAPKNVLQETQRLIYILDKSKVFSCSLQENRLFIFGSSDDMIELCLVLDINSKAFNHKLDIPIIQNFE